MQVIYNYYELLSWGIFIGPIIMATGFILRKKKSVSRTLLAIGCAYFIVSTILVFQFVQSEKEIVRLREEQETNK